MITIDVIGQLIPNPMTMLTQLCSTLVLFLFVKKFLWTSVTNFLNRRSEAMQQDLKDSAEAKKEAEADREAARAEVRQARETSRKILERVKDESEALKTSILTQAKKEAELKMEAAEREIEAQKKQAHDEMVHEMVSVAMAAAEKLINEKADAQDDARIIEEYVRDVKGQA
ncbi:MAG: F0F1 ATP synthase subunit B [Erysipelotrichaceae bacterium]|nr:F0F1 ATP synthase subunit B [Erysipelotrichaceae bacterium]